MNVAQLNTLIRRAQRLAQSERTVKPDAGYEFRARRWDRIADEADALVNDYELRAMYRKHNLGPPPEETKP